MRVVSIEKQLELLRSEVDRIDKQNREFRDRIAENNRYIRESIRPYIDVFKPYDKRCYEEEVVCDYCPKIDTSKSCKYYGVKD